MDCACASASKVRRALLLFGMRVHLLFWLFFMMTEKNIYDLAIQVFNFS